VEAAQEIAVTTTTKDKKDKKKKKRQKQKQTNKKVDTQTILSHVRQKTKNKKHICGSAAASQEAKC